VANNSGKIDSNFVSTSTLFAYTLPTAKAVSSSTVLMSDTSGNVSWNGVSALLSASTTIQTPGGSASTTVYQATVPAGVIGTSNAIRVSMYGAGAGSGTGCSFFIEAAYGTATTSATLTNSTGGTVNTKGTLTFYVVGNGATNSQHLSLGYQGSEPGFSASLKHASFYSTNLAAATDSTAAQQLLIRMSNLGACGSFSNVNDAVVTELLRL
jgi:hypothetical protein